MRLGLGVLAAVLVGVLSGGVAWAAPLAGPVRFEASDDSVLRVLNVGAYHGAIEVKKSGSRLTVVNEVTLERYVEGLAEVPPSWPMEALKAQAVAARTYALWEMEAGAYRSRGYDLCATTACQVYAGAAIERSTNGQRWIDAVAATKGEILDDGSGPILARFFSSSGGRTLPNELVYPSSGARSYLKSVPDPQDKVAPLHQWTVEFTNDEMSQLLAAAFKLAGEIKEITSDQNARKLVITTGGGQISMNIVRFRREISTRAAKMFPEKFPGVRVDGGLMPITLPSSRFDVSKTPAGWKIDGRGYGHGVGMSQWGAKGRAEDGEDYIKILGAYYGGLKPTAWKGRTQLRVGLASAASAITILGEAAFSVTDGGSQVAKSTLGTWRLTPGSGRTMTLQPPTGYDLPLLLSGVEVPDKVDLKAREATEVINVGAVLPKSARLTVTLKDKSRTLAGRTLSVEAGTANVALGVDPEKFGHRGVYKLEMTAFDGSSTVKADRSITITTPVSVWPKIIGLLALAGAVLAGRSSRKRSRRQSADGVIAGHDEPQA